MRILNEINLRLDGILGLEPISQDLRDELIREASESESFDEFLRDWLIVREFEKGQILFVKIWIGLSYDHLASIFDIPLKEVVQMLRMARIARLPPYRVGETEAYVSSDWSCFLVEQHLSPWIDGELESPQHVEKMLLHLSTCDWCRKRLDQYRTLQTEILDQRPRLLPISESEWSLTLQKWAIEKRRLRTRIALVGLLICLGTIMLVILASTRPEKIPNVYEIPENI